MFKERRITFRRRTYRAGIWSFSREAFRCGAHTLGVNACGKPRRFVFVTLFHCTLFFEAR